VGCVHVYTGDGKGKTTAAVGLAVRALGHGLRVCFIQFLKPPDEPSGELEPLRKLGADVVRYPGQCPTFTLRSAEEREALATSTAAAWADAARILASGEHDMVVLDELNPATAEGLIDAGAVAAALRGRPESVEVVITGRGALPPILDEADLISCIEAQRHPFDKGNAARRGVDW